MQDIQCTATEHYSDQVELEDKTSKPQASTCSSPRSTRPRHAKDDKVETACFHLNEEEINFYWLNRPYKIKNSKHGFECFSDKHTIIIV